jgi:hypothetical protein
MAETKAELITKVQRLQTLVQLSGTMLSRIESFSRLGYQYGGDRDIYEALGYKTELDSSDYYAQYSRQDIAKAIINKPVSATWRGDLTITESSDDNDTPLEIAWKEMEKNLSIKSKFSRLDKLVALGHYGVLLLGFDDVQSESDFFRAVIPGRELLYVKPLTETSAQVQHWEDDPTSERYGLPNQYQLSIILPGGQNSKLISVHHSRIIHVAGEDLLENEIEGAPRLEVVFNRLKDLEKIVGGSGEMFWRGARPGYQGKVDPEYNMTEDTIDGLKEQISEYEHNLRRILVNQGVDLEALAAQVSDPSAHVEVQLQMISAVTGIPKRILVGSERGELASSQDRDNWFDMIQSRREEFAEPRIVRPFIDRCIEYGALPPATEEGYGVEWQSLYEQSDKDKAEVGKIRSETLKNYSSAPVNQDVIPPEAFFKLFMNLDDDQIELIQEQRDAAITEEEMDFEEEIV